MHPHSQHEMELVFETPEKRTANGESIFYLKLSQPGFTILHDLEWIPQTGLVPVITVQKHINELRSTVLKQLVGNKTLFRNPPTLASVQAITPPWGILVQRGNQLSWSTAGNKWISGAEPKVHAVVRLIFEGVEITRTSIIPVWNLVIQQIIPDQTGNLIDFDLEGDDAAESEHENDVRSVSSDDFTTDDIEPFRLTNPNGRKKEMKEEVRRLMHLAAEAQTTADNAMSRFFDEFNLSDGESDFSDDEED